MFCALSIIILLVCGNTHFTIKTSLWAIPLYVYLHVPIVHTQIKSVPHTVLPPAVIVARLTIKPTSLVQDLFVYFSADAFPGTTNIAQILASLNAIESYRRRIHHPRNLNIGAREREPLGRPCQKLSLDLISKLTVGHPVYLEPKHHYGLPEAGASGRGLFETPMMLSVVGPQVVVVKKVAREGFLLRVRTLAVD